MDQEDAHILETVMTAVSRYGMKRTTMGDIAKGAGVSRQTLYDRFGDKDEIMAAAITYMAEKLAADLEAAFAAEAPLSNKIDAYYEIAVWPTYEVLQKMPDAADLQQGLGAASKAAGEAASLAKQTLLSTLFSEVLPEDAPAPDQVAAFFEQASHKAKMSGPTREELAGFLSVLKAMTLALAAQR